MKQTTKQKIEDFIINIQSSIFYYKNKKTGVSKDFIKKIFNSNDKTKNIMRIISTSKTPEDLKNKAKRQYETISDDLFLENFIIGVQTGLYPIANNYFNKNTVFRYLEHDYTTEDTNNLIELYREIIYQYILTNNKEKNNIQRGTEKYNDFTQELTPELIDSIIASLSKEESELSRVEYENVKVIKNIIFKLETLYPKKILFTNKDFVTFELLTGLTNEYFNIIDKKIYKKTMPSIEERLTFFEERKSLTHEQSIKLDNIDLLEQRIKSINHPNKKELLELISRIKNEKSLLKKIELIEECHLLYEITYREEIVDSLYTPTSSNEITDIHQVGDCLIHKFMGRSGNLLSGYDQILKQRIINESRDKNLDRELTSEEQIKYNQLMDYAENVLANKFNVEETIENDLIYSDRNGFRHYKSDTQNQISTSIIPPTIDAIRTLRGFIGIGFDRNSLPAENIAVSSPIYQTTNMGIDNLEIPLEKEFEELSAPLSELENSNRSESEIVLFRKGTELPTKAAYVFVGVENTTDSKYIKLITEAKKLAEENHLKLIIFNIGKMIQKEEQQVQEITKSSILK